MATFQLDIGPEGWKPDTSGGVSHQPYSVFDTATVLDPNVLCFNNSSAVEGATRSFIVPQNYVGSPKLIVLWNANATTGTGTIDLTYLNRTDAEDMGAAAQSTSDTTTTTTDGTAFGLNTTELSLTAGNFAAGDVSMFEVFRDSVTDSLAATMLVHKIIFEYADT